MDQLKESGQTNIDSEQMPKGKVADNNNNSVIFFSVRGVLRDGKPISLKVGLTDF